MSQNESIADTLSLQNLIDKALMDLNNSSFDFAAQFEGDSGNTTSTSILAGKNWANWVERTRAWSGCLRFAT